MVAAAMIAAGERPADDRSPRSSVVASRLPVPAQPAPTPARAPARSQDHRVFVIGDSLTVGTEPWLASDLRRSGWLLVGLDARVGRPASEGLRVLRADAARLPNTVLLALGTNDLGASPSVVAAWLRDARAVVGGRRIIWVNLCLSAGSSPRLAPYRTINAALRDLAPRYGVEVADWCAYAARHDVSPGPDGIHYATRGYEERAAFYAMSIAALTATARP